MELRNLRWSDEELERVRKDVLSSWPTGKEVHFEDAVQFHNEFIGETKNLVRQMSNAKKEGRKLIHPLAGVATIEGQIELIKYLQDEGGADYLPVTVDSYTRMGNFKRAKEGLENSVKNGKSLLNGCPIVVHGVHKLRQVVRAVERPIQVRCNGTEARLAAEIAFASGGTGFVSGAIWTAMNYNKDMPFEKVIRNWQYIDRLIGKYTAAGAPIVKDVLGSCSATAVPPSLAHAAVIVEALLAAEQGVKYLVPCWFFNGNIIQDVSSMLTLSKTCRSYLDKFGHTDVVLFPGAFQWDGPFPTDHSQAYALICWNTVEAMFTDAVRVAVKTTEQAEGVPSKESNAASCRAVKFIINLLQNQKPLVHPDIEVESAMIEKETRAVVDKLLEMGEGDIAQGVVRGFAAGVIEAPFAASNFNAGNVMTVRDAYGAARFLDFGNLPFCEEIRDYHRAKVAERQAKENRQAGYEMIVDSILSISKGYL